jgi:hypothetical protein
MKFLEKVTKMSIIDMLIVVVALYAAYMVYKCSAQKEHMFVDSQPSPVEETGNDYRQQQQQQQQRPTGSCGSGNGVSTNLLPKKPTDTTGNGGPAAGFEFAPLQGINFLTAEQKIGIDSIHSSLRNANHSFREDPHIPKTSVGPWMNSTIDPDPTRKPIQ